MKAAVAIAFLLLLLISVTPGVGASASASTIGSAPIGQAPSSLPQVPSGNRSSDPDPCSTNWTEVGAVAGPLVPFPLPAAWQGGCPTTTDAAVLAFRSPMSGSGDHFEVALTLPSATVPIAGTMREFWVGSGVSGFPCSADGLGYSQIVFVPPYAEGGNDPNWSVRPVVWGLVSPGSGCYADCQNASAFVPIGAARTCEIALPPMDPEAATNTTFHPGDRITVTFTGNLSGGAPAIWYTNDTTSGASIDAYLGVDGIQFSSAGVGPTLAPLSSNASATGWEPFNVAIGVDDCPWPSNVTLCNSYSTGGALSPEHSPVVNGIHFWDPAGGNYSGAYAEVGTWSSSGGCSGENGTADCSAFSGSGGARAYPTWQVVPAGTASSGWELGGSVPGALGTYGNATIQFDPTATTLRTIGTTIVVGQNSTIVNGTTMIRVELADPSGVASVDLVGDWCTTSGTSPGPITVTALLGHSLNSTEGWGNWSAPFPLHGFSGTLPYYLTIGNAGGGVTTSAYLRANASGGGTPCSFPAPPAPSFSPGNVTAISGGYRLSWSDAYAPLQGYELWANGSTVSFSETLGNVTGVDLDLHAAGSAFHLTLIARSVDGLPSAPTVVSAVPTLPLLTAAWGAVPSAIAWNSSSSVTFPVDNVTGGAPPYTLQLSFGDGSSVSVPVSGNHAAVTHSYGDFRGTALIAAKLVDTDGSEYTLPPLAYGVSPALNAILQTVAAGDGFAMLRWSFPSLPTGVELCGVVVYYALAPPSGSSSAPIVPPTADVVADGNRSAPWLNASQGGGSIGLYRSTPAWDLNMTPVTPDRTSRLISAPYGWAVAAAAVAVTSSDPHCRQDVSVGLLPEGSPNLPNGISGPFLLSALTATPTVGTAPEQFSFVATAVTPNGTRIFRAEYLLPNSTIGAATVTPAGGAPYGGESWGIAFNATFSVPGGYFVTLHVIDTTELDALQSSTQVEVTSGPAPLIHAVIKGAPNYVGVPVTFGATAIGSGPFAYDWSFGDGANGSGASASHAYSSAGEFTVLLTVTNTTGGGHALATLNVTIDALPSIAIESSPGPNGSLSFLFTAIEAGGSGPFTITWSFGDGTIGHGVNATHTYAQPGLYLVNVSGIDPAGRAAVSSVGVLAEAPTGIAPPSTPTLNAWVVIAVLVAAVVGFLAGAWLSRRRSRGAPSRETPTYAIAEPEEGPAEDEEEDATSEEPPGTEEGPGT